MSGGVNFGHKGGQPTPIGWNDEPPCAADGPDLYIQKLLTRGERGDSFSSGGKQGSSREKGSILSSITKWAGLALAGVLGFLGLKKFVWPRLFR